MAVTIKSYYKTTPIDEETLANAIASAKDQENKIYQLFKKYGVMTSWDVYDVYNEIVGPILLTSVARSINTLLKQNIISSMGTVIGDAGRPVNIYELVNSNKESVERMYNNQIPKSIKLDLIFDNDGQIDVDKMVENLDLVLSKISVKFDLKY